MKYIAILLLFIRSFANAQQDSTYVDSAGTSIDTAVVAIDSTRIPQTIILKAKHLCFIKSCINTSDIPQRFLLFQSVASQLDSTDSPEQDIIVTVESGLIVDIFIALGQQQEYYSALYNQEMQTALMPQVTNPWLLARIQEIGQRNADERERRRLEGYQFFRSIKQ